MSSVALADWTLISGECTPEGTIVYEGTASLRLLGITGQLRQRIDLPVELEDKPMTMTCYAYATSGADGGAKIGVTANGTLTQSAAVTADSTWRKLTVNVTPNSEGRNPIYLSLHSAHAFYPVYFDRVTFAPADAVALPILPLSEAFRSLLAVWMRNSASGTFDSLMNSDLPFEYGAINPSTLHLNGYLRMRGVIPTGTPIKMEGRGTWPALTSLTDTVPISSADAPLVAARAALLLVRWAKAADYLGARDHWAELEAQMGAEDGRVSKGTAAPSQVGLSGPYRGRR